MCFFRTIWCPSIWIDLHLTRACSLKDSMELLIAVVEQEHWQTRIYIFHIWNVLARQTCQKILNVYNWVTTTHHPDFFLLKDNILGPNNWPTSCFSRHSLIVAFVQPNITPPSWSLGRFLKVRAYLAWNGDAGAELLCVNVYVLFFSHILKKNPYGQNEIIMNCKRKTELKSHKRTKLNYKQARQSEPIYNENQMST